MFDSETIAAINRGSYDEVLETLPNEQRDLQRVFVQYLSQGEGVRTDLETILEDAVLNGDWKTELESLILLGFLQSQEQAHSLADIVDQTELLVSMHNYPSTNEDEFWIILFRLLRIIYYSNSNDLNTAHKEINQLEQAIDLMQINQIRYNYLQQSGRILIDLGEYNRGLSYYLELLFHQEELSEQDRRTILAQISRIYSQKGHLNMALYYYKELLKSYEDLGPSAEVNRILREMAMIFLSKADYALAIQHLEQSISISNQINDTSEQNWDQFHLAITQYQKGEWENALATFQSCKEVLDSAKEKLLLALIEKFLGNIYRLKGDFVNSRTHYNQSIALLGVLEDDWNQAEVYNKLGLVELQQGEYHKAHSYFQKSLSMYSKFGARNQSADPIFNLIRIKLELGITNQLNFYLQLLEKISNTTDDKIVHQKYQIAQALIHKQQPRMVDKVEALKILENVVDNPIVDAELHILSMIHLSELLLAELLMLQNSDILEEIISLSDKLMEISTEQKSFDLQIDTLLLQSKLALIEGSAKRSLDQIRLAKEIARKHQMMNKMERILSEEQSLNNQLSQWEELTQKNASIRKRMEFANIQNYIDSLLS